MSETRRQTFYPLVNYSDPAKAIEWLESAFGFVPHEISKDDAGKIVHAEMRFDTGIFMISQAPAGGGTGIYAAVDDPDAHHDRAKAAGAEITMGLTDQPYGSREYAARDLEGNQWYFGTYRP
ncbi:VOC family protein [Spirillospora sp. NPDC048911]|uniref:VOC family protein n=1 Tax=Spirillospora sp. NPDC048911 TaxID=3364527 RepID=UPI003717B88F